MSVIQFDEPWAVRLMPKDGPIEQESETEEICPLLAVDGVMGLVIRQREMFWWPLERMRVILQPEPQPDKVPAEWGQEPDQG